MFTQQVIEKPWMERITKTGEPAMVSKMDQRGFTLIEMLIVISLIGILASISAPNFQRYIIRAKEASLRRTLFVLRDVVDQYYSDHGKYPDDIEDLADEKYIRSVPKDPFTNSTSTWIIIPPEGSSEEGGFYDVHSGSYLVSLQGVPYNEW